MQGTNTNTILIVILIIILIAGGAFWYTHRAPAAPQQGSGLQVNLGGGSTNGNSSAQQ